MDKQKARKILFAITVFIIISCVALMIIYSGFEHETKNAKNLLLTVVIVIFFQILFADPIKFLIISIDMSIWPRHMPRYRSETKEDDSEYNRLNFLKQRLSSMRVQMLITERYRNEALNSAYKMITQDLILYGKYFIILACLVLVSRDGLMYYNTAKTQQLLLNNHTDYVGLKEVYNLNQLFDFVKSSLVDAFEYGTSEEGASSWVHSEQTKLLGVVRLRQLRLAKEQFGWNAPEYTDTMYMPGWQLPYQRLHYTEKYWRTYDPWLSINGRHDLTSTILLNFDHVGRFQNYPELCGYVVLLARNKENNMKILDFLTEYHWLNYNTSAVFMDFTLYNTDADMFSVCTLRVERTPFGSIIPDVNCDSIKLVNDVLQLPYLTLLVVFIYFIVVLQFNYAVIVNLWYEPKKIRSIWFKLDLLITVLNIFLIAIIIVRSSLVASMLKRLEGSNKLEFVDFRKPARLHILTFILAGFLISAITLRLWKVLQFSKVFQLFTTTLYLAWKALAITALAILIVLIAFGLAFVTINGNNSPYFVRSVRGVITASCFSLGFSREINPSDLFYGGRFIGMIMYASLGFIVSVLLINVFMTTIHDYFTTAKADRDKKLDRHITFFQFLRVEYYGTYRFFKSLPFIRKEYKRHNRTVAENVQHILDKIDQRAQREYSIARGLLGRTDQKPEHKNEESKQAEYRERVEHIYAISTILNIQMEILERVIFDRNKSKKRKRGSKKNNDTEFKKKDFNDENDSVV